MKVGQIVRFSYGHGLSVNVGVVMSVNKIDHPTEFSAAVLVTQSSNPSFVGELMGVVPNDLIGEPFGKGL
jgi:hypothetical protein